MNTGEIFLAALGIICATIVALAYVALRYGKTNTKETGK